MKFAMNRGEIITALRRKRQLGKEHERLFKEWKSLTSIETGTREEFYRIGEAINKVEEALKKNEDDYEIWWDKLEFFGW